MPGKKTFSKRNPGMVQRTDMSLGHKGTYISKEIVDVW
jgi:hypothetical protein